MSVRGELRRTLNDTIRCLNAAGAPARELTQSLEQARDAAERDLPGAARDVLAAWDEARPEALPLDAELRARLDDASGRALAIARIILGR